MHRPPEGHYVNLELSQADLCYEDEWLIAVNKRAGWYVGATPWDRYGNVLAALDRLLTRREGVAPLLHLAHQLDRHTSGILLISRHPQVNKPLLNAFANHRVEKHYLALCTGEPCEDQYELHHGHGRSKHGRWRLYPLAEVGVLLPEGGGRIKLAHTSFSVKQRLGDATLLHAYPHTGRTHQIRLHAAAIGHPLLGDTRYGGPADWRGHLLAGHLLHAARIRLDHPITNNPLNLSAAPPDWLETLVGVRMD